VPWNATAWSPGPCTRSSPRVDYELTKLGTSLLELVGALETWAQTHMDDVLTARAAYDARPNPTTP
jgi:DNA-binding HxlR family transcriptional regulator